MIAAAFQGVAIAAAMQEEARARRSLQLADLMTGLAIHDGDDFTLNGQRFRVTRMDAGPLKSCGDCAWFRKATRGCMHTRAHPGNLVEPASVAVPAQDMRGSRGHCGHDARWFEARPAVEPEPEPMPEWTDRRVHASHEPAPKRRGLWDRFVDSCIEGTR